MDVLSIANAQGFCQRFSLAIEVDQVIAVLKESFEARNGQERKQRNADQPPAQPTTNDKSSNEGMLSGNLKSAQCFLQQFRQTLPIYFAFKGSPINKQGAIRADVLAQMQGQMDTPDLPFPELSPAVSGLVLGFGFGMKRAY